MSSIQVFAVILFTASQTPTWHLTDTISHKRHTTSCQASYTITHSCGSGDGSEVHKGYKSKKIHLEIIFKKTGSDDFRSDSGFFLEWLLSARCKRELLVTKAVRPFVTRICQNVNKPGERLQTLSCFKVWSSDRRRVSSWVTFHQFSSDLLADAG